MRTATIKSDLSVQHSKILCISYFEKLLLSISCHQTLPFALPRDSDKVTAVFELGQERWWSSASLNIDFCDVQLVQGDEAKSLVLTAHRKNQYVTLADHTAAYGE